MTLVDLVRRVDDSLGDVLIIGLLRPSRLLDEGAFCRLGLFFISVLVIGFLLIFTGPQMISGPHPVGPG